MWPRLLVGLCTGKAERVRATEKSAATGRRPHPTEVDVVTGDQPLPRTHALSGTAGGTLRQPPPYQPPSYAGRLAQALRRSAVAEASGVLLRLHAPRPREALAAVDAPEESVHKVLGAAQEAITPPTAGEPAGLDEARRAVAELIRRRGWRVDPGHVSAEALAVALATFRGIGHGAFEEVLDDYAAAVRGLSAPARGIGGPPGGSGPRSGPGPGPGPGPEPGPPPGPGRFRQPPPKPPPRPPPSPAPPPPAGSSRAWTPASRPRHGRCASNRRWRGPRGGRRGRCGAVGAAP